ncbi:MAG TPA: T9SS type A sorting domain-containing protein [Chitinophagaceae bacterium]|nr:T9SS type A sorting domain-containing protein [Chitinophagaceae bacterium]
MLKKILTIILVFSSTIVFGQLKFKAGLIPGPTANSVDIVISPTVGFNGYLTNVIFVFQIPQGVTQPAISKTSLTSYFTSFSDLSTLPNEGGYTTYGFSASNASITTNTNITAGTNFPVMRLTFTNGSATSQNVRLAHLADGGPGSLYQNYIEANDAGTGANDYTNYVQMFFGSTIVPASPLPDEGTGYSTYQYAEQLQVLPVSWLSFDVIKKNNDALLNWTVANEELNHHFEILRSQNGTDFSSVGMVNKAANNNSTNNYSFTDTGIDNLGSSILYYRIRQIDINGKNSLSDIRILRLVKDKNEISIFPNPVKTGFYVSIPSAFMTSERVGLNLINMAGQLVLFKTITAQQATNYYVDISGLNLAAGQYQLKILKNGNIDETKRIIIVK